VQEISGEALPDLLAEELGLDLTDEEMRSLIEAGREQEAGLQETAPQRITKP
jgi:hypothetical protein